MKSAYDMFCNVGSELIIKFDSPEAALHFKDWLCEAGEQDYWEWMRIREEEEDGNITALDFNYHTDDSTIVAECGRLDGNEVCNNNEDEK